jgi:phospholipid/cholesterol/gamma-HCH transport system permease protein
MDFEITTPASETLKLTFLCQLDNDTVPKLWNTTLAAIKQQQPSLLILDLKNVTYCNGAGIALLQKLQSAKVKCEILNLKPDFQNLLTTIEQSPDKSAKETLATENLPTHLGHITVNILNDFRNNIIFLGTLIYQLCQTLLHPKKLRWADFWRVIANTGPEALPIIALIGFLIGLISTFQSAASFGQFGVQIYIVNLVGLGLVREMGPLLTAVLLAGRTASSFAAELGTMKINQEVDALTTMGLNTVRFLVLPRVLATMLVTPLLEVFLIFFGLVGCFVVMLTLGYSFDTFIHQLNQAIDPADCIGGLAKVFVFGLVIASVGCLNGLKTRFGAQAVGHSTTQAVVSSLIMIVIVDGIFATIYYILGI